MTVSFVVLIWNVIRPSPLTISPELASEQARRQSSASGIKYI